MKTYLTILSLPCFALLLLAVPLQAATVTVTNTNDALAGSLRQAILDAKPDDVVAFKIPTTDPGYDAATDVTTINLTSGELLIDKNLTINGPGAKLLTVRRGAEAAFRIFDIAFEGSPDVTISGLSITDGYVPGEVGGGILKNGGNLNVTDCAIASNSASSGGGIFNNNIGSMFVGASTITDNSVSSDGGAIYNNLGTLILSHSTISANSATLTGGGIHNSGVFTVTSSTIAENLAESGGGIYADSTLGSVSSNNTIVALNGAGVGPDFFGSLKSQGYNLIGNNSDATIAATTGDQIGTSATPIDPLLGPLQDSGGSTETRALLPGSSAIDKGNAEESLTDQRGFARPVDSPVIANLSDGSDIGSYEVQSDQLAGCTEINLVVNNSNDSGTGSLRSIIANACGGSTITFGANVRGEINLTSGELLIDKNLTISGPGANLLSVQRSSAGGTAAFRIFSITSATIDATISGLTIANGNAPSDFGGGISNTGTLTLINAALSGNSATFGGGGIQNNAGGVLTINGSTISGNTVDIGGSGIFNEGELTISNSTISGNTASGGNGGGIINGGPAMTLTNSTVCNNTAGDAGGGIHNFSIGSTVSLRNTIVALNIAASSPDVNGPVTSEGFNLIGNNSGAIITPGPFPDQIGVTAEELNLAPLQDNGGPTKTHALLAGSRAIDKGDSSGSTIDQRGLLRPFDISSIPNGADSDGADIGAFEFDSTFYSVTLANVSTRLSVQTGDNVLIGGFIVTGTQPKTVLVRAIGPSLPVAGGLANPTLELHDASSLLASNDNWKMTQQAEIQATNLAPGNDLESAIIATLPANSSTYTAIVRGANNSTGIGLVEVYDLDRTVDSKLANISTRGLVQTGDNVMIGGLIVAGSDPQTVIIRASGPSLPLAGTLADPSLELHDSNGTTLVSNDNWRSDQETEILATNLAPSEDSESAIVRTLTPAAYTAIVRAKNDAGGVALIEVYALSP